MRSFFVLLILLSFLSCSNKKFNENSVNTDEDILVKCMTGTFSSQKQAELDSTFFNINLVMIPICQNNTEARWLYIEQAASYDLKKPYRQRIYKLNQLEDGTFTSLTYELPNNERFIHSWEHIDVFNQITPDSLTVREGCTVFLKKLNKNEFSGSTETNKCNSTLLGASYATSKVQIFKDKIISWDQGWNHLGEQVWGAETSGYIFNRIN